MYHHGFMTIDNIKYEVDDIQKVGKCNLYILVNHYQMIKIHIKEKQFKVK